MGLQHWDFECTWLGDDASGVSHQHAGPPHHAHGSPGVGQERLSPENSWVVAAIKKASGKLARGSESASSAAASCSAKHVSGCKAPIQRALIVHALQLSGQVLYNGLEESEFDVTRTAAYVQQVQSYQIPVVSPVDLLPPLLSMLVHFRRFLFFSSFLQYDVHLPTLTVRETLAFAQACIWSSGARVKAGSMFSKVGILSGESLKLITSESLQIS